MFCLTAVLRSLMRSLHPFVFGSLASQPHYVDSLEAYLQCHASPMYINQSLEQAKEIDDSTDWPKPVEYQLYLLTYASGISSATMIQLRSRPADASKI